MPNHTIVIYAPAIVPGLSPEQMVALIYRGALARHRPPTQAVADHYGISQTAAAKRVERARRRGHLQPTKPGRKSA